VRASEVRAKIVAAVEGATVDDKASASDVFTHLEVGTREIRAGRDRLFVVAVASVPLKANQLFPTDNYLGTWDVTVMYADSPQIEDRICKDVERMSRALEPLPSQNADINTLSLVGGPISEFEGRVTATIGVEISYRLDSSV